MSQTKVNDLQAFLAVARERSFTKAAARLGITASALSHTVRALEERLGVRLLARTTRNVAVTDAGERLMHAIAPLFEQIAAEVEALGALRDKPNGTIRVTCTDDQIELLLRPMLAGFLQHYPDIKLELFVDYGFTNVVEQRFDAGIRLGEAVSKDMIAVPIGPPLRMAVVGSPGYFAEHGKPRAPQDLTVHRCINQRMVSSGGLYVWDFARRGQRVNVRVDGPLIFNTTPPQIDAALAGLGLTLLPEDELSPHLQDGSLVRVLQDWCPPFDGYHLYYPSRRQPSPAFILVVEALRWREGARS